MKKLLTLTALVSGLWTMDYGLAFSQIYNNSTLTVQSGANLYFDGAAINQASGTIANSGTLHLKGDFTNNGTAAIAGTVKVDGSGNQSINGVSDINLLDVDKSAGTTTDY